MPTLKALTYSIPTISHLAKRNKCARKAEHRVSNSPLYLFQNSPQWSAEIIHLLLTTTHFLLVRLLARKSRVKLQMRVEKRRLTKWKPNGYNTKLWNKWQIISENLKQAYTQGASTDFTKYSHIHFLDTRQSTTHILYQYRTSITRVSSKYLSDSGSCERIHLFFPKAGSLLVWRLVRKCRILLQKRVAKWRLTKCKPHVNDTILWSQWQETERRKSEAVGRAHAHVH